MQRSRRQRLYGVRKKAGAGSAWSDHAYPKSAWRRAGGLVGSRRSGVAAVAIAWVFSGLGTGVAQAKPTATLSMPSSVEASEAVAFTYTATGIGPNEHVYLQRPIGTTKVWRNLQSLTPSTQGSASAPAVPMGTYHYRIAVLSDQKPVPARKPRRHRHRHRHHGHRAQASGKDNYLVYAGPSETVRSYATVPFAQLLESEQVRAGSEVVGDYTFNYLVAYDEGIYNVGVPFQLLNTSATSCRSLHIELGSTTSEARYPGAFDPGFYWIATLRQQTQEPVSVRINEGESSTLTTAVIPGQSWNLSVTLEQAAPGEVDVRVAPQIFVNGSANCYATSVIHINT